ncbi:hypothetical protein [Rhodoferax sp. PAMC 29310]|uniref:hypothetical protein n=1 Tax=Rhodoferax sp. PAMC 29310 TaxID=2822760 RepID=UPI001B32AE5F|nr:hypothetical protein [Rhodoferax sp. PAMC 29310]
MALSLDLKRAICDTGKALQFSPTEFSQLLREQLMLRRPGIACQQWLPHRHVDAPRSDDPQIPRQLGQGIPGAQLVSRCFRIPDTPGIPKLTRVANR